MSTYSDAGVSIDAGNTAVELMKAHLAKARRPEVVGDIGGFAGLFDISAAKNMKKPLLATSTDGVGTKTEIARALGKYDTIGEDLVAMVVDDLVVCGAEPLFMTDYIAVGKVFPERVADIVAGIARGCEKAGTALVGGETAEHPGLLAEDEFDIAGAATGVVDEPNLLGEHLVKEGDILIAMPSSGFHSNGYSLVRHIIKKAKFYKSTETNNLKQAEAIAAVWVINWKNQIEKARTIVNVNSADANVQSATKLYEEYLANDNPMRVKEIMEEEEIRIRHEQGETAGDVALT